jgi:hypothetical protein
MPVPKSLLDFEGNAGSTAQRRRLAACVPRSIRCLVQHLRLSTVSAEVSAAEFLTLTSQRDSP